MTKEQKEYIEKNITLISNNEWEEFFKYAPYGMGTILYKAGINFIDDVNSIPENCFYEDDELKNIILPDNIISIGNSAFQRCSRLSSINIPDSVIRIGDTAFTYCTDLTNITIGNGVTSIGYWAFSGCSKLTKIEIPSSMRLISWSVFEDCSNLLSIDFKGTKSQWAGIALDTWWCLNSNITHVVCTDGIVDIT